MSRRFDLGPVPGRRETRAHRAPTVAGALRVAGILICLGTAVAVAVERYAATDPRLSSTASRLLQAFTAAEVIAVAPAVLVVMSWFGRSVLLLVAAEALWPFAVWGLFFPVLLPLGLAAILLMCAFAIGYDDVPSGWLRAIAALVIVPPLLAAAALVLFFLDGLWTHPAVTVRESSLALLFVQAALLAGWALTMPRPLRARREG